MSILNSKSADRVKLSRTLFLLVAGLKCLKANYGCMQLARETGVRRIVAHSSSHDCQLKKTHGGDCRRLRRRDNGTAAPVKGRDTGFAVAFLGDEKENRPLEHIPFWPRVSGDLYRRRVHPWGDFRFCPPKIQDELWTLPLQTFSTSPSGERCMNIHSSPTIAPPCRIATHANGKKSPEQTVLVCTSTTTAVLYPPPPVIN